MSSTPSGRDTSDPHFPRQPAAAMRVRVCQECNADVRVPVELESVDVACGRCGGVVVGDKRSKQ